MITDLTYENLEAALSVQPADWGDIRPHLEFYIEKEYCHCLTLSHKNRVVGIGAVIYHADTAWFAHIVVHEDFRKRGFGSTITTSLINIAKSNGYNNLFLDATEYGYPVYKKLRFKQTGSYTHLKLPEANKIIIDDSNISTASSKEFFALIEMDMKVSGENRIKFISPFLKDAKVYKLQNEILGAYIPSLGDGYIMATETNAGLTLLEYRAQEQQSAVIPSENKDAIALLIELGFVISKESRRMTIAEDDQWQPKWIFNRISGQVG